MLSGIVFHLRIFPTQKLNLESPALRARFTPSPGHKSPMMSTTSSYCSIWYFKYVKESALPLILEICFNDKDCGTSSWGKMWNYSGLYSGCEHHPMMKGQGGRMLLWALALSLYFAFVGLSLFLMCVNTEKVTA